jgi:hypothetical protein
MTAEYYTDDNSMVPGSDRMTNMGPVAQAAASAKVSGAKKLEVDLKSVNQAIQVGEKVIGKRDAKTGKRSGGYYNTDMTGPLNYPFHLMGEKLPWGADRDEEQFHDDRAWFDRTVDSLFRGNTLKGGQQMFDVAKTNPWDADSTQAISSNLDNLYLLKKNLEDSIRKSSAAESFSSSGGDGSPSVGGDFNGEKILKVRKVR